VANFIFIGFEIHVELSRRKIQMIQSIALSNQNSTCSINPLKPMKNVSFSGGLPPRTRIEITDTLMGAVIKLSEGNPGAMTACVNLLKETPKHDPQNILGGIGTLLNLDSSNVYGSRIWCLYKDVCGESTEKTIKLLRAKQMGIVDTEKFNHAIDHRGQGIDLDSVIKEVNKRLDTKA